MNTILAAIIIAGALAPIFLIVFFCWRASRWSLRQRRLRLRSMANEGDPGTGATADYRKMVLSLLGLNESANEEAVKKAYNTAMATDADPDDKAIKSKVADMEKANEKLAKDLKDKETLAANEAAAKKKAEDEKADLQKKLTAAEGNFANERQARIGLIVSNLIIAKKITAAEKEATEKLLANATDFDAEVKKLTEKAPALPGGGTASDGLGGERSKGVSNAQEFANEVAKVMVDQKLTYDQAYSKVKSSEKGKALLAGMHQPESAVPQRKAA
jgi:hypothetical protein